MARILISKDLIYQKTPEKSFANNVSASYKLCNVQVTIGVLCDLTNVLWLDGCLLVCLCSFHFNCVIIIFIIFRAGEIKSFILIWIVLVSVFE